jgi:hypothetical protein
MEAAQGRRGAVTPDRNPFSGRRAGLRGPIGAKTGPNPEIAERDAWIHIPPA